MVAPVGPSASVSGRAPWAQVTTGGGTCVRRGAGVCPGIHVQLSVLGRRGRWHQQVSQPRCPAAFSGRGRTRHPFRARTHSLLTSFPFQLLPKAAWRGHEQPLCPGAGGAGSPIPVPVPLPAAPSQGDYEDVSRSGGRREGAALQMRSWGSRGGSFMYDHVYVSDRL